MLQCDDNEWVEIKNPHRINDEGLGEHTNSFYSNSCSGKLMTNNNKPNRNTIVHRPPIQFKLLPN